MTILGNFGHLGTYARLALALTAQCCLDLSSPIPDRTLHVLCYSYMLFSITLIFYFSLLLVFVFFVMGYEGFHFHFFWGFMKKRRYIYVFVWGLCKEQFSVPPFCRDRRLKIIFNGAAYMCSMRKGQGHAKASKNRTANLSGLFLLHL